MLGGKTYCVFSLPDHKKITCFYCMFFIITKLLVVCSCVEHKIWSPQPWIEEFQNADKIHLSSVSLSWSTSHFDFSSLSFLSALYRLLWVLHAKSLQSCPPLCDPVDCSPPGSSVPGSLQARTLEWVAVPSSRAILCSRSAVFMDWAPISSLPSECSARFKTQCEPHVFCEATSDHCNLCQS